MVYIYMGVCACNIYSTHTLKEIDYMTINMP